MTESLRARVAIAVAIVLLAGLPRLLGAFNELWLDEVWSIQIAQQMHHLWDPARFRHGNNHVLTTMWIMLVGDRDEWVLYRLPSVVAGTAAAVVVTLWAAPARRLEGATAGFLVALSFPLVMYSVEARGYATAILFALAAYYALDAWERRRSTGALPVFWASIALGALSHGTIVHVYLALFLWSLARTLRAADRAAAWRAMIVCHTIPALSIVALYAFFLRGMIVDPPAPYSVTDVVLHTVGLTIGTAPSGPPAVAALVLAVALLVAGTVLLARAGDDALLFFLAVVVVAPATVIAVSQPSVLYFRYFLVSIPFFYLLAAHVLAYVRRRVRGGALVYAVALVAFAAGQLPPIVRLIVVGRTGCRDSVRYMGTHTHGSEVVVASDHDFRNSTVLWYYSRFLPAGQRMTYVDQAHYPIGGTEWFLVHRLGPGPEPPSLLGDRSGNQYARQVDFECGGVSRWHWYVYRRQPAAVP